MLALVIVLLLLLVLVVPFLAIAGRRRVLQRRGGTIELSVRLRTRDHGQGWSLGIGRFEGEDLAWYRVFSIARGPRRRMSRRDLVVCAQRPPAGGETRALLEGTTVMECRDDRGDVWLAMDGGAVTGFLAWLEATPPGATLPR